MAQAANIGLLCLQCVKLHSSTTLLDPQLMKPAFGVSHPLHVSQAADKQEPGEDLLHDGAHGRKREPRPRTRAPPGEQC